MKNKYDVYMWILKVIDSCDNLSQWGKCIRLIKGFEHKYPKDEVLSWNMRSHYFDYNSNFTKVRHEKK